MRAALSQGVQDVELFGNGLPVNAKSLQKLVDDDGENHYTTGSSFTDPETGEEITMNGRWPTAAMRARIQEVARGLTTLYLPDKTLLLMIKSELAPFFAGRMDAQRATAAVAAKVRAYLAE